MDTPLDVAHFDLMAQKHFSPSQEPDVTRSLPSGWRSMTIVPFSVVATRSGASSPASSVMF
ncbi:MAG: hypothetical protein WBG18_01365, partial [Xanthobacteraceae bacterium]